MSQNNTTIPENLKAQIRKDAEVSANKLFDFKLTEWGKGCKSGSETGYIDGATSYAVYKSMYEIQLNNNKNNVRKIFELARENERFRKALVRVNNIIYAHNVPPMPHLKGIINEALAGKGGDGNE